ncbi:MAG: SPOR domain-containing protein [SAR324 cluster bacterium]|nr:SPOR domain-containing protein [SAR324 cluster bacterium]
MATSSKRSPLIAPRSRKTYRLEMEGRTIMLMVSLMALTGVVVFSLGIVTGMGMRAPSRAITVATISIPPTEEKEASPDAGALAFNQGVKALDNSIEGLKSDGGQVSSQTKSLLERAERELKLEELPAARSQTVKAAPAPKVRSAPAEKLRSTATSPARRSQYTVQVFSSRHSKNARELMLKLKKQGFDAYLNQFQGSNRETWYRVRVGKVNRSDAQRLVERLMSQAKLKAPRIVQL